MPVDPIPLQIRNARVAAGLTQQQLAEAIGIASYSVISRLESGEHEPRRDTLQRIANVTGATFWIEVAPAAKQAK